MPTLGVTANTIMDIWHNKHVQIVSLRYITNKYQIKTSVGFSNGSTTGFSLVVEPSCVPGIYK